MRVAARYQREVDTGYINEQRSGDKKDGGPEAPIAMGTLPVRDMAVASAGMRPLFVMRMCLTHSVPRILNGISIDSRAVFQPEAPASSRRLTPLHP